MTTITQFPNESRPAYLMRVAAAYILAHNSEGLIEYDGAVCDGNCLAEELTISAQEISLPTIRG